MARINNPALAGRGAARRASLEQLLTAFELTETMTPTPTLYEVRGWIIDELHRRDPAAWERWMDSDANVDAGPRIWFASR